MQDINDQIQQRLKKLEELRVMGINPYGQRFEPTASAKNLNERHQCWGQVYAWLNCQARRDPRLLGGGEGEQFKNKAHHLLQNKPRPLGGAY